MTRKLVLSITLIVVLVGMLGVVFEVQRIEASGTIYIRSDGSIEGTTDISTVDNVTYTFTDNINDSIEVERSNIIIDGAGYTLQGSGSENGFVLWGISNTTIKNADIKGFEVGVYIGSASKNIIFQNNITENYYGMTLWSALNNSIVGNNISWNDYIGINVYGDSSHNTISGNNIRDNVYIAISAFGGSSNNDIIENNIVNSTYGIHYGSSNYNTIIGNNITDNSRDGIHLTSSSNNNTIIRNNITASTYYDIYLERSSNNSISRNRITPSINDSVYLYSSIYLFNCSKTNISENNVTASTYASILLEWSSNNSISGNHKTASTYAGILLRQSSNNSISGNDITASVQAGVWLESSSNNTIYGNNITNNWDGIWLDEGSNYNTISENSITKNHMAGIGLRWSSNNTLRNNAASNNEYNFGVYGPLLSYNIQDIDDSNTVNGKPVYYWVNRRDMVVPLDAGYVALVNCTSITVQSLNLTSNGFGVKLVFTTNSTITKNNITNNGHGIQLGLSSNYNTVSGNKIIQNSWCGIVLFESSNNKIYHNSFIDNTNQTFLQDAYMNIWDDGYPSGGNYWSNYTGVDLDYDGIGDTSHVIDANNTDNYPLMGMFSDFNATSEHHVQTICNSAISDFQFNGTAICFNVTGETDTTGFCRICIPRVLMNETYKVFVNGTEVQCNLLPCSNTTHSYLYFTYNHSTQEVIIIPEFPSFLILPLFMIATLLAVIVYRRRKHCM